MNNRKFLIICICIVLLLVLLVPVPRKMEESYTCHVLDQDDDSYRDQVTVTFTGTYSDYLLRKDKFLGKITIEGYDFMSPDATNIEFSIGNYEENWIHEYIPSITNLEVNYLGTFYACEDFDSFFLWLMVPVEENPNASRGRYLLTYPKMDFQEIYSILDKINA